ncbi:beta-N-acetylhexosaminidase [Endozoicomonadaceae bacterium StTr2]
MDHGILMLDLEGERLTADEQTLLLHPCVAGVILFTRNYSNPQQLAELVEAIRNCRPDALIVADQEGGRVQRFRDGFTLIPPMGRFGQLYHQDETEALNLCSEAGWLMASELIACDIDLSLAPVVDLDRGNSRVIGDRGFDIDPGVVAILAGAFVNGMREAGMTACAKHFPGHGWVDADSHVEIPTDLRDFDNIMMSDLKPFREMVSLGVEAVMPAHVSYPACDPKPAGFSKFWLQTVLREQIGFKGIICSDDLSMTAAGLAGDYAGRAKAALDAGCNLLFACNNRNGWLQILEWLEEQSGYAGAATDSLRHRHQSDRISLSQLQQHPRWLACRNELERKLNGADTVIK